jgi:hypothetical protein
MRVNIYLAKSASIVYRLKIEMATFKNQLMVRINSREIIPKCNISMSDY